MHETYHYCQAPAEVLCYGQEAGGEGQGPEVRTSEIQARRKFPQECRGFPTSGSALGQYSIQHRYCQSKVCVGQLRTR